jgi:hypothetical protein
MEAENAAEASKAGPMPELEAGRSKLTSLQTARQRLRDASYLHPFTPTGISQRNANPPLTAAIFAATIPIICRELLGNADCIHS